MTDFGKQNGGGFHVWRQQGRRGDGEEGVS